MPCIEFKLNSPTIDSHESNNANLSNSIGGGGGRLRWFAQNWKVLTKDPWILNSVLAAQLELISLPFQSQEPFAPKFSNLEMDFLSKEVNGLREKGAIEVATPENNQFVGFLFPRPKKQQGEYRPIFNLKPLNQFIRYKNVKIRG